MLDIVAAHIVRIHVNRVAIQSPTPTTGEALYALANIPKHETLYREIAGEHDDERIPRDETPIHLTKNQRFYSQKGFEIFVNGDEHEIDTKEITYARVVDLYLGQGGTPSNEYLVKYSHGPVENRSGTLAPGQKVKVKDGMRFRVAGTGES
ncbi:multiubiquitin domain-containing protein [Bosea vaviloviae]|uniref:multiubiquitin domain-containing protein n=1 Tax=Bosea vaviloviae TaxID=1526658 RepID=UPI0006BAF2D6|nr:multiubiquitin domain-containing protein [Bosea vaviloviae]